jgi:hypothetical protein
MRFYSNYIIITTLVVSVLFISSCGQDATKQKELELKERELSLREKEVALKEKEINKDSSAIKLNTNDSSKLTSKGHSDFKTFWKDFKMAVLTNDKNKVLEMTHVPFVDKYQETYNTTGTVKPTLTCNTKSQFLNQYSEIFIPDVLSAIKADKYRGYHYEELVGGDAIQKGEYLVTATANSRVYGLAFRKWKGIYQLSYMPYFE